MDLRQSLYRCTVHQDAGNHDGVVYNVYNYSVNNRNVPSLFKYHNGLVDRERVADPLAQIIADGRREGGNGETRRVKERASRVVEWQQRLSWMAEI